MKRLLLFLLLLAMSISASPSIAATGPVRHVVAFKFKAGADPAKIKSIEEAFVALKQKISIVQQIEAGKNISPESHDKGFTHIWIVSFKNEEDRNVYLVHPDHKAFAGLLKDVIDDVLVLDFIPQ